MSLELGSRVEVTHKLTRKSTGIGIDDERRTYTPSELDQPITGVFMGWRYVTEGVLSREGYIPRKRFRVATIVYHPYKSPMYVLMRHMRAITPIAHCTHCGQKLPEGEEK